MFQFVCMRGLVLQLCVRDGMCVSVCVVCVSVNVTCACCNSSCDLRIGSSLSDNDRCVQLCGV